MLLQTVPSGSALFAKTKSIFREKSIIYLECMTSHRVGGNRKRNQESTNADQKSIETVLSVAICRQWGDKWQSKKLFLLIFITFLDSSGVFDCRLPGVDL